MANYVVTDQSITSVANAIRTKGGTSDIMHWPNEFVSAIQNIPTGGGGSTDGDVIFIDYDGSVVTAKTKAEINAMTSDSDLPANPTHTGLTSQGWNWTVAQLKAQFATMPDQNIYVGQMYTTTSGATEIDVVMQDGRLDPILTICPNGTISVDWGDNTTPDSVTGASVSTRQAVSHTYASAGNYTIKISLTSGTSYGFYGSSQYTLLRRNTSQDDNYVYANSIKKIRLGAGAYLNSNAFLFCRSLSSITIPSSVTNISSSAFNYCYSLKSITIPSGVTSISGSSFMYCYSLNSITIPSGVTSIGSSALNYCLSLTNITIPSGVTSIGSSAFYYCMSLSSIRIPSNVTSIGSSEFTYCILLKSITIPSGVTSIGNGAFNFCSSLTSIPIPSSVTSIGSTAFYYCYALPSITIPSKVTSIGNSAFQYCYALKSITIPSSVTSIGESAFYYCYSLSSITIPSGVTSIGKKTFLYCYSLSSITMPNTVTSIGDNAFQYCYTLPSITISSNVTSIGVQAFQYCYSLSRITIPSSVTSIGNSAFSNCNGMKEYHFERTTPPTLGTTAFNAISSDCIIYVPYSADHSVLAAYQAETNWSTYASYMQEEPAP